MVHKLQYTGTAPCDVCSNGTARSYNVVHNGQVVGAMVVCECAEVQFGHSLPEHFTACLELAEKASCALWDRFERGIVRG